VRERHDATALNPRELECKSIDPLRPHPQSSPPSRPSSPSCLPAVVSLPHFTTLRRPFPPFLARAWGRRTRHECSRERREEWLDEGASAGKFALHFSRRTATSARTLPRREARAGSFVSPRFVCFAHYPSPGSSIFHYVRRLPRENN